MAGILGGFRLTSQHPSGGHGLEGHGTPGGPVDEDGRGVAVAVGRDRLGLAVAVEVAEGEAAGGVAGAEGFLGLKGAVTFAQQHRHVVATAIRGSELKNATLRPTPARRENSIYAIRTIT